MRTERTIMLVNPNSTESMTNKVLESVKPFASPGYRLLATNPVDAPPSIEGYYDEAMSVPGLLRAVGEGEKAGADAFIIACFGDPGLNACREIATGPVLGICEAAMYASTMIADSFSIVTTLQRSVPKLEGLVRRYGMETRCRNIRAAGVPVLALEDETCGAREIVRDQVALAVKEDRCEAVILGCAGMADLTEWLSAETNIPVIDGCVAAVKFAEALVGANLRTSKVGSYARPRPKVWPSRP